MDFEKYPIISRDNFKRYTFYSEGPNGRIKKVVFYRRFLYRHEHIFNLSFGDWESDNDRISDLTISNNGDLEKILATVASTVVEFLKEHPKALVYAEGATASRTRLYQIKIAVHWVEICKLIHIYGRIDDQWQAFQKGVNYKAFLAELK